MALLYFEDVGIGTSLHAGPYTVSRDEIIAYASKWDPQPFHVDETEGRTSIFGGLTASGCHTFAISALLAKQGADRFKSVAALGTDELRFPHPVRPDDQLWFFSECIDRRASRSRPAVGIVTTRVRMQNQHGVTVLTMKTTFMVQKRHIGGDAHDDEAPARLG